MKSSSRRLRFENALILTNDSQQPFIAGHLEITDDRISGIFAAAETEATLAPDYYVGFAEIYDLRGRVIIPGLVQGHIHLCQTLLRNQADDLELLDWLSTKVWPYEAAHNEASLRKSAALALMELLSSGTTAILDMGTVRHTNILFETCAQFGMRATIGKCLMDSPASPNGLREEKSQALQETWALAERWHGQENGRLRYAVSPRFAISCTEELLRECVAGARQKNYLLHTHASENREEIAEVRRRSGKSNLGYLHHLGFTGEDVVLAHCVWPEEDGLEILQKSGTHIVHCPAANLKLASGFAPIPQYLAENCNVALGADGAPCNNSLSLWNEMRLAALIHKPQFGPRSLPAQQVFQMATRGGAKALGLDQEIAVLRPGRRADFVVLNLEKPDFCDPGRPWNQAELESALVYTGSSKAVESTWIDGICRYQAGTVFLGPQGLEAVQIPGYETH